MPLYTRRAAPIDGRRVKGFLDNEFQNIQRAFRSGAVYPIDSWETGVVDVFYPVGDIRRYGAVSGGSAFTNTVAFRNALLSLPNGTNGMTGGVVLVPTGTWAVDGIIGITRDNATILCESGAIIDATVDAADMAVFFAGPISPVDNFTIEGATITGAFPWGIRVSGGSGHKILRNTISGGTVAESGKCGGIYGEDISDFEIGWNVCSGNGDAALDSGGDIMGNNGSQFFTDGWIHHNQCTSNEVVFNIGVFNPIRVLFESNTASGARVFQSSNNAGGYGIMLYNTPGVSGQSESNQVVANNVRGTEGTGIYIQNVHDSLVEANLVDDTGSVMDDSVLVTAGIVFEGLRGVCSGNKVYNSHRHGIVVTGGVDATLGGHRTLVTGNHVSVVGLSGPGDGIVVDGVTIDEVTIDGNYVETVDDGSAYGCRKFSDVVPAQGIVITNNRARDITATGAGIYMGTASDRWVVQNNVLEDIGDFDRGVMIGGTDAWSTGNIVDGALVPDGISPDRGDADITIVASVDYAVQRYASALSGNRTVTLSSTNARRGAKFRVARTGLGAFTLDVGGLKTIPSATAAFVDVEHDGTAWRLTGYGTL